jgi:hypothetical protein
MLRRTLAAAAAAIVALTLGTSLALAGGWAEIQADAATTTEPPVAGEPARVGFMVLQHGVTPAGWVTPTVVFRDVASGQEVEATVAAEGADGHFVATATLPAAGMWTWSVTLAELITETPPSVIAVRAADGSGVPADPAIALQAVEQVRRDVTQDLNDTLYQEVERLDLEREALRANVARLEAQVHSLQSVVTGAGESPAATTGGGGESVPVLGIVMLAVLAGATAGFVMAWLGGRATPRQVDVALSPAPRSSTPAS